MHMAVERGDPSSSSWPGAARMDIKDKRGRTPLDIAMGASPGGFTGRRGAGPGRVRESTAALLKGLGAKGASEAAPRP